jgi:uncharacterized protein (DUF1330 family)
MSGAPVIVAIELAGEHGDQLGVLRALKGAVRAGGGDPWAAAPAGRVGCLEPGTVAAGLLLARFPSGVAARAAMDAQLRPVLGRMLPPGAVPTVLCAEALPDVGLPDMLEIPTVASVPLPPDPAQHCFLLIRGRAWDQPRLDRYRDIILPMHKERGGYYESFAVAPGQVVALSGTWQEEIFAVSRWPSRAAADDFWYSERYQCTAIPLRIGAGRFTVHQLGAGGP